MSYWSFIVGDLLVNNKMIKEDLLTVLEIVMLNYEGKKFYELIEYKVTPKHIKMANDVLNLINERW